MDAAAPGKERDRRYDAFISYRHVEPDRKWAKWLHTALETYRVPRRMVRTKGVPSREGLICYEHVLPCICRRLVEFQPPAPHSLGGIGARNWLSFSLRRLWPPLDRETVCTILRLDSGGHATRKCGCPAA